MNSRGCCHRTSNRRAGAVSLMRSPIGTGSTARCGSRQQSCKRRHLRPSRRSGTRSGPLMQRTSGACMWQACTPRLVMGMPECTSLCKALHQPAEGNGTCRHPPSPVQTSRQDELSAAAICSTHSNRALHALLCASALCTAAWRMLRRTITLHVPTNKRTRERQQEGKEESITKPTCRGHDRARAEGREGQEKKLGTERE